MPYKNKAVRQLVDRQRKAKKRKDDKLLLQSGKPESYPDGSLGDVVADWAESRLVVPTGPLRGQPFKIAEWQRRFLVDALGSGIREAGLSVARKNGKSGLIAALLLAYLVGPLNTPPRLKKYIDATRIVAGASVPTSAACIGAAFNLLAAEDIDVQSRANAPHPAGLYFVVGSESGWRKSASFRETMQGHVEADERVEALHHEADSNTEEGMEFRARGFSPRALRQDFTIEALLSRLWKARRTMAVANSDASSLLGGWSFRRDNLSRSLSHFVSLWDGDPTSIDRRNPETPEIFFYQRRLTALIMGQVNVAEELLFSQAAGNGFTARCLPSMDRERPKPPADSSTTFQAALDTIAHMRELVIRRRVNQDANVELLQGVQRRPVIHPDHDARDLLAAASARFDALADATDNLHERGFWARAQEQTARYAATLAYVRTLAEGIPESWDHVYYTRPEVDQAEAVITWHGDLIKSYAIQAASEKVTRLANETITMLREKTGEGGQGGRQHSGAKCYRQAGQGRDENRRRAPGTGA